MKEVFVKLVRAGSRTAFRTPRPTLIRVPEGLEGPTLIGHFQIAVHDQCNSQVGHVDANELDICDSDASMGIYLDPLDQLNPKVRNLYFVEVPPVPEPRMAMQQTPSVIWTAAEERPHLAYRAGDRVIELTKPFLARSGVGRVGGGPLTFFCRQQFIQQWNEMNRHSIENEAVQWIVGPPGTGKSCTALAFTHALGPMFWDVLWITFTREREAFMCVWLRGNDKVTCVIPLRKLELLVAVLNSTSRTKCTVLFLDGYATTPYKMEKARLFCKEWHYEDTARHRLVYVCSMARVSKKYRREIYTVIQPGTDPTMLPTIDVKNENTDQSKPPGVEMKPSDSNATIPGQDEQLISEMLYKLESWSFQDYEAAIMCDVFFQSVADRFEGFSASADPTKEKTKILEQKYYMAGGNARLMFDVSTATAMSALDDAIDQISNLDLMSQSSIDASTASAINRLQAGYHRLNNKYETRFLSDYVARTFAVLKGPELLGKVARLCDVNPAMDSHLF